MTDIQPEVSQEKALKEAQDLVPFMSRSNSTVIKVALALYNRDQEIAVLKAELEAVTRFKPETASHTELERESYRLIRKLNHSEVSGEFGWTVGKVARALAERDQRINEFATKYLDCQDQLASARAMLGEQEQSTAKAVAHVGELEDRLTAAEKRRRHDLDRLQHHLTEFDDDGECIWGNCKFCRTETLGATDFIHLTHKPWCAFYYNGDWGKR